MGRADVLLPWVIEALEELGGSGSVVDVSRVVWARHAGDLGQMDDLFYTWQYDLRWAAQKLRDAGVLHPMAGRRNAPWELVSDADADRRRP